jgi:hypothetical protein
MYWVPHESHKLNKLWKINFKNNGAGNNLRKVIYTYRKSHNIDIEVN